jgi:hypothetical protein
MSQVIAFRRILSRGSKRFFHASAVSYGDALDMADTFSRRHCKYFLIYIIYFYDIYINQDLYKY